MRPVLEVRERGAVDEVPAAPCCVRCLKRNGDPEPGSVRSHGNAGTSQRLVLPPLTMAERPDQGTDSSALGSGENGKLCDIRSAAREPAVLLALAPRPAMRPNVPKITPPTMASRPAFECSPRLTWNFITAERGTATSRAPSWPWSQSRKESSSAPANVPTSHCDVVVVLMRTRWPTAGELS